jgi:cation transport regulator ChaC
MEKEKSNNQNKISNQGYVIVPNYFLREWVKILGIGPTLLYLELLTYCRQEKDLAWPTLTTLSNKLGSSKNSLISYRNTLLKYGLIKKIVRRRSAQGNYRSNLYQITPLEGAKNGPGLVQNLDRGSPKFTLDQVQNLNPNNNNIEHYQYNNKKEAEKGVVVAVDFKILKKKGEEKMQALREQLTDLSFEEKFIEQILKDFSLEKIEEKLELLKEKKNIINPAGWLLAALKNDYQDSKEEEIQEVIEEKKEEPQRKISSREEALRQIRLAKEKLALITPYYQIKEKEEKGGLPLGT